MKEHDVVQNMCLTTEE